MTGLGVGAWIERRARLDGERPALICGDVQHSYTELAARIRRLAHGLRSRGVERGDRVGYLGANHPAFLEGLFACAKLGAIMTPINHRLAAAAVDGICENAAPRVVLVHADLAERALPAVVGSTVVFARHGDPGSEYERLIAQAEDAPIDEPIELDDPCMLPYTSGTTGPPKGITLTHGNVTWNVINFLSCVDFHDGDVTIAIAPFFRTGGSGTNVLPVLWKGGTVVVPERLDPDEILRLIEAHRATIGFGNPDLLAALTRASRWASADLSSIRVYMTGGAPVPERLLRTYHERGITFLQGYGLSEAAPLVCALDPENTMRKLGSAGRPPLYVDVRIVDPEGNACPVGEIGELLVRGPNVMAGYWNDPEATRRVLEDGWLRTGDAVRADEEGFLFVDGRVANAYVRGGRRVHPGEAERRLLQLPAVAEACVVGREDAVTAFVVRAAGAEVDEAQLLAYCDAELPAPARPTRVKFVDSLPRNPGGKIMRHRLELD